MAALAEEFVRMGIQVFIRCAKPGFLFSCLEHPLCSKDDVKTDFGIVHRQDLKVDYEATRSELIRLMSQRSEIVAQEINWLREQEIQLVIADIPFLIIEACTYAKIPAFAVTNFEWAFTYHYLFKDAPELKPLINTIYSLYQRCELAFRLPFSSRMSMGGFRKTVSCGLLARRKDSYPDIRDLYDLNPGKKILACTFGGETGIEVDLGQICKAYNGYVISANPDCKAENHVYVLREADWLDIIRGCDQLLCKPGYSTFAEAVQFNRPIFFFHGSDNPETDVLINGLKDYPQKLEITQMPSSIKAWKAVFAAIPEAASAKPIFRNQNRQVAAKILSSFFAIKSRTAKLESVFDIGSNNLNYLLLDSSTNEVLHAAHFYTHLGRLENRDSIKNLKHTIDKLMAMQRGSGMKSHFISASVARENQGFTLVQDWLYSKHGQRLKVISQKREARLAWLAAQKSLQTDKEIIVIDIGGLSTEFIWGLTANSWHGINIGLLNIIIDPELVNKIVFPIIPDAEMRELVLAGLTGSFFASVILKQKPGLPWKLNRAVITTMQMEQLAKDLNANNTQAWLPYLQSNRDESILRASHALISAFLRSFKANSLTICYYGISYGYFQN